MIHMMIVDDEPIAVNYLLETLQELEHLDLELSKAYSGYEALEKLGDRKVDILLTDIRMPGMTGMELADQILKRWPRCKAIFLTGYDDFAYAQSAIRKGGVDYVLKTEGDEAIVRAIEKAIADIRLEINEEHILQKAKQQIHLALPSLRREYLVEFLQNEVDSLANRKKRFANLAIDLDPELPIMTAVGRIDEWGAFALPSEKPLLFYSIQNIAEEYLSSSVRFVAIQDDRSRFIWFIQPKDGEDWTTTTHRLGDSAELVQSSCKRLLKVPISLALEADPCPWEHVSERVETLKLQLGLGIGRGKEMLITGQQTDPAQGEHRSSRIFFAENDMRSKVRKLDLLETYMDNGEKEPFTQLFMALFQIDEMLLSGSEGKFLAMELFSHLSAFFLSYLNRRRLFAQLGASIDPEPLLELSKHASWHEAIRYFRELGETLADFNGRKQVERTNDIIGRIHHYIHEFLHEDLSLTKLSELVYLSSPYLSRLYKQMTGKGVLDYITEVRINKAKLLLKTGDRKINEIATEIGLESAHYFTRLFKKVTGYTPLEYRDSAKAMDETNR
ncbi:response regulator [Paenibacillus sp. LMG 31458]|uniref:Response regulator n=1 Tax=Paenibacillus phytorum TaxID=2654977 RepID=A0ABX1XU86_9BACL|nr:response regulator [Paenibacillus phytorum]NOU71393.1 response regulator [Paenibacillus phytorum]